MKVSLSRMSEGYLYCLSNPSMPGILKIGMTERTPEDRAKELFTTGVALPFKIEFAKKVKNPKDKEIELHDILDDYIPRVYPRREFFRASPEQVLKFFKLMDGEMWNGTRSVEDDGEETDSIESTAQADSSSSKGCRDMSKCFTNGQRIRHTISADKTRIGIFDSLKNGIVYDGKTMSLNQFVTSHIKLEKPERIPKANAWIGCECEVNGIWIPTNHLPELS